MRSVSLPKVAKIRVTVEKTALDGQASMLPVFNRSTPQMAKKTFLEVQRQIEQLQKEAEQLRKQEASEVLARIKEAISVYGFTAAELGVGPAAGKPIAQRPGKPGRKSAKRAATSAGPKYRDDSGNVWSGRGPRPAWFRAALEAGKSPEDFLV